MDVAMDVLIVGNHGETRLWEPKVPVDHRVTLRRAATLAEANAAAENCPPELVFLLESRPGEYHAGEVQHLRRAAPLARIWHVQGPWCDGQGRSGPQTPGAIRCYWHQWPSRFAAELARLERGQTPAWAQPATMTDEDRLLAEPAHPTSLQTALIMIDSPSYETAAALGESCQAAGYAWVWSGAGPATPLAGAGVVLWDASTDELGQPPSHRRLRQRYGDTPVIALVDFPRPSAVRQAYDAGIAAVIANPFHHGDLLAALERACTARTA